MLSTGVLSTGVLSTGVAEMDWLESGRDQQQRMRMGALDKNTSWNASGCSLNGVFLI